MIQPYRRWLFFQNHTFRLSAATQVSPQLRCFHSSTMTLTKEPMSIFAQRLLTDIKVFYISTFHSFSIGHISYFKRRCLILRLWLLLLDMPLMMLFNLWIVQSILWF